MSGIVILEEDDLMRGLLEEWLAEAGYAAWKGGLANAPAASGADLVIVDLNSPREAGPETVRAARAAYPGAPVIAISGRFRSGLSGCCAAAQALGAQAIVAKPFSRDDLLAAVHAVIGTPASR
jgi:DNA-binding response OmpR family regulator